LAAVAAALGTLRPLIANMVEGGRTPLAAAAELERLGFSLVIFPGGIVRVLARTMQEFYARLAVDGTTAGLRDRMLDFEAINALVGTPEMLDAGKRYAPVPASTTVPA
jgi:2-methylisocitrate lyase-like PEP mutase family enzyme